MGSRLNEMTPRRITARKSMATATGRLVEVEEGGCHFLVNLTDYRDAGLFLDHRPLRAKILAQAEGTRFLNLYCYTGAATVHAAMGGARTTTSVDTSGTYLEWARKNLAINGLDPERHRLERADCLEWLREAPPASVDLVVTDPPYGIKKAEWDTFESIQSYVAWSRTWIEECARVLRPHGSLYICGFSEILAEVKAAVSSRFAGSSSRLGKSPACRPKPNSDAIW